MTSLLDYHNKKAKYYLDTLEVVLNAEVDKHNRNVLVSMLMSNKSRYEQHKAYVEWLEVQRG